MVRGTIGVSFRGPGRERTEKRVMPILLWLLGIPIPIIILLVLLSHH
jgi:hypothetical protein